ncbi:MAG: TonB-dependent receptor, partial [Candidatus Eremiobacteraeota bacterium]|nr:TonB-dependent receptor [Candidatus Eremiobacteraeota bacterium]
MSVLLAAAVACCTITGDVRTAGGAPVASAIVSLSGRAEERTTSDRSGAFSVRVEPGNYDLDVRAPGFVPSDVGMLHVDHNATIVVVLDATDSRYLRPIGSVTVDGHLALSRYAVPSVTLSRAQFDQLGQARVVDGLLAVPSVTLARPDGGAPTAPAVVALRGPDPSETLVALDGQILNDGNTGDTDLSQIPVAAFTSVNVSEGLGPRDLEGSNTIGGAVDFVSLQPTRIPHAAFSLSAGSFGQSEGWVNAT